MKSSIDYFIDARMCWKTRLKGIVGRQGFMRQRVKRSDALGRTDLAMLGGSRESSKSWMVLLPGPRAGRMVGIRFAPHDDDHKVDRPHTQGPERDPDEGPKESRAIQHRTPR